MSKHHHWLARQIPQWVEADIISAAQAEALRKRHPLEDSTKLGRLLLTGLAAVMIGLGIILLFAYNWSSMDKASKLAVIFFFLIVTHHAAMRVQRHNHVYSESLFALGTMPIGKVDPLAMYSLPAPLCSKVSYGSHWIRGLGARTTATAVFYYIEASRQP